ncbi:MAG: drug:proton antiporter [Legionella longbeachae]|nr:drug:proton antiporter [Legionella longbeachae]
MSFDPNLVLFYVINIENSKNFYSELLNAQPIHNEPDYVMFSLKSGLRLGLWSQTYVEPQPIAFGGGSELAIQLENDQTLDELFERFQNKNFTIIQTPTHMDFGYTFVTCDYREPKLEFLENSRQFT